MTAAWEDYETLLDQRFVAARLETNWVQCSMKSSMWLPGIEVVHRRIVEPVQLLCRTLRLAHISCRRFELTAAQPGAPLNIEADVAVYQDGELIQFREVASYDCVAKLAAAKRPFAVQEGLTVSFLADIEVIVLSRDGV